MSTTTSDSRRAVWNVQSPFSANQVLATISDLPLGYYEFQVSSGLTGPVDPSVLTNIRVSASGNDYPVISSAQATGFNVHYSGTFRVNLEGSEDVVVTMVNAVAGMATGAIGIITASRLQ